MKKIVLLLTVLLLASCATKNAEQKAAEKAFEAMVATEALRAIQNRDFVLEADRVYFKRGKTLQVSSDVNFISVKDNKAVVQLALNPVLTGQNGLGGITVEGVISKTDMKTDKKGNITYTMHVDGVALSAIIYFKMLSGTNQCTATVTPNMSGNIISFDGTVVPTAKSTIFTGISM